MTGILASERGCPLSGHFQNTGKSRIINLNVGTAHIKNMSLRHIVNVMFRHILNGTFCPITTGQKAAVGFHMLPLMEAEAAENKRLNGVANASNLNNQDESREVEILPPPDKYKARDEVGRQVGVSGKYISDAKAIAEQAPEVFKKVALIQGVHQK